MRIFTSRHLGTVCVGTQHRHLRTILRKQCEQWCCWTSLCLPAGESVNPPGYKMMKQAYHSGEFDVLREVRLIGQGLFGGQESQVLGRDVWSREGSAIVSMLENDTDAVGGLCQLRDDAWKWSVLTMVRVFHELTFL